MAYNFYFAIQAWRNKAYDTIYDGLYTNYTQAASVYNVPLC